MDTIKKYLLVLVSFLITLAIGAVGAVIWMKKKVVPTPVPTEIPPPKDFIQSLKDKKEKIDETVHAIDRDALADDINSNYE